MPIDVNVIEKDARSNIADWPATIRFQDRILTVHLSAASDLPVVQEGGILDDMEVTVVCITRDFGSSFPESFDLLDVQQRDGSWKAFEVRRRPDAYDPVSPTFQLIIGAPSK